MQCAPPCAMRLQNCVYGVDINPESVLSAKCASSSKTTPWLAPDYHLACGNFFAGRIKRANPFLPFCRQRRATHFKKSRSRRRVQEQGAANCQRGLSTPKSVARPKSGISKNLLDLWTALQAGEPLARHLATWIETGRLETEIAAHVEARAKRIPFFFILKSCSRKRPRALMWCFQIPAWEHNEIREKEWFCANGRQDIGNLAGSERKRP